MSRGFFDLLKTAKVPENKGIIELPPDEPKARPRDGAL
jgi:hypothetical protein